METLPVIGNCYMCYDDGKVSLTRAYIVKIIKIFTIDTLPQNILERYRKEQMDDPRFYSKDNKYFIYAESYEHPDKSTISIFTKTFDNKWFSFGLEDSHDLWNCGLLDIDNMFSTTLLSGLLSSAKDNSKFIEELKDYIKRFPILKDLFNDLTQ